MTGPRRALRPVFAALIGVLTASCGSNKITTTTIDFEVSEGTDLAFDLSPDGRTIVFDLLGQLWTLPVEGGRAEPLTDAVRDTSEDLHPVFAPDGNSIAFLSDRPVGGLGIFTMSLADRKVTRLTTGWHLVPSWSPDGKELAFVGDGTIQLIDLSTGETRPLEIDGLPRAQVSDPTWSPLGESLVFVNAAQDKGRGGAGRLWEVSREGGIASLVGGIDLDVRGPAFSPDGSRLAFFAQDSASLYQLWVTGLDRRPVRLTSHDDVTYLRARWLPGATRLLYHADGKLWTVSVTGGEPTEVPFTARIQLTRKTLTPSVRFTPPGAEREARGHMGLALAPGGSRVAMIALGQLWVFDVGGEPRSVAAMPWNATGLSWSPNEREIVWSAGPSGAEDLYATDLTTGDTRQVTGIPGSETVPSWSPDGQHIAFIHWEPPELSPPMENRSRVQWRLLVTSASTSMVETIEETTDLGTGYTTWGNSGPRQDAPLWSPDSQPSLLFARGRSLFLASLDGGRREIPVPESPQSGDRDPVVNPAHLSWPVAGELVYVEDGLLWRAAFDSDSGRLGEVTRISDDAALYASTSKDGSILYESHDGLRIHRPTGQVEHLGWPLAYRTPLAAPLLIRNVLVITEDGVSGDVPVDILTDEGRFVRIGPSGTVSAPDEVRVVDGGGRIAIPGLIDVHSHLWDDAVLPGQLYYGITTYRDVGSTGVARLAGMRDGIEAGYWAGPRIVYGGVLFMGTGRWTSPSGYLVSDDSARARATGLMAAFGADYLKMRLFDDWAGAAKLVEAAHARGWTSSGHIALPLPIVAAGIDGMEHLGPSGYRTHEFVYDDIIQLFRRADVWVAPTILAHSSVVRVVENPTILDDPETASLVTPYLRWSGLRTPPVGLAERYDRFARVMRATTLKLHEGGVRIAAGTDAPFLPWVLHAELEELVTAGFSPLAALTAATATAAEVLGASDEIGSIEEGKWADLVILNSDPLEDIRNTRDIWMVIKGGEVVDREALKAQVSQ